MDSELAFMFTVGILAMILLSSESEEEFWGYVIGFGGFVFCIILVMSYIGAM